MRINTENYATRYQRNLLVRKNQSRCHKLTIPDLEILAPAVFAPAQHDRTSPRYNQVSTVEILTGLRQEGWAPCWVDQQKVRDNSRNGYQKHIMRLRHLDHLTAGHNTPAHVPEIVLINSHDGSSSFQIHAGIFRMVCSNGMVVADSTFDRLRVIHTAEAGEIIDAALKVPAKIKNVTNSIEEMEAKQLTAPHQHALAEAAAILRWGSREESPIPAANLLSTHRTADAKTDLWTTFNRVQENVTQGGQRYIKRTKAGRQRATVRPVKGIDQNTNLNKALWHLAETLKQSV